MPIYSVVSDPNAVTPRKNTYDAAVVIANGTTEAKKMAGGVFDGDAQAVWDAATVTSLATLPAIAALPLTGWVFNVQVGASGANANVTVTGDSDDTLDDIGAKLVVALNATAINGAAYNTSTNVLTVAETTDTLGDKDVTILVTPPTGFFIGSFTWVQADLVASVTDLGSSGAALKITFSTTWQVPTVVFSYKQ